MPTPVIFKDLPATFPEEDKHKMPAAVSSIVFHIVLVTTLILVPLLMPQRIEHWQLMTWLAPVAPPQPTYLNGEAVPVILSAKVNFELGPLS